jgi:pimeloyl-ACP methyl ester carboxylesterase
MSTWLLLRGLTREAGHWGAFPGMLRERLPGARVVAIDLPGNGSLHNDRSPACIEDTVESCRRQLQAMAIETPVHLLAMSLGAMVAVEWARRYPDELAACVLVNTSLRPFSPWYRRLRPANYAVLLGLLRPGQDARRREEAILRLTSRHPPQRDAVIGEWTALREAHPVSAANALRQLLAATRYRAPAEAPVVPLLVLSSRRDALVDVQCSRALARAWGVASIEHPTAGHDLALDDGTWLARQVGEWAVPSFTCARRPAAGRCPSG